MKEGIKAYEKDIMRFEKNIEKFNRALDETAEIETINVLAKRISGDEEKAKKANERLAELQVELEKLNIKYAGTEEENMYYNVKDRIHSFFKKLNVEEQRNELIKTVKQCVVTGTHIIIDSGANLFIFNTGSAYKFDPSLLKKLDDDKYFKISFLGQDKGIGIDAKTEEGKERLRDLALTDRNIREFGNVILRPVFLDNREFDTKTYVKDRFRENGIDYELEGKSNAVFFYVKE
jgi:hypothetical protein